MLTLLVAADVGGDGDGVFVARRGLEKFFKNFRHLDIFPIARTTSERMDP